MLEVKWYTLDIYIHIDGLVQERRKSIANALELRLSCTDPSMLSLSFERVWDDRVKHFPITQTFVKFNKVGSIKSEFCQMLWHSFFRDPRVDDIDVNIFYELSSNTFSRYNHIRYSSGDGVYGSNRGDMLLTCTFDCWCNSSPQNSINKFGGRKWDRITDSFCCKHHIGIFD